MGVHRDWLWVNTKNEKCDMFCDVKSMKIVLTSNISWLGWKHVRCFIICGGAYDFMTVIAMPVNCFAFIWEAQIVLLGDLCILGGEAKVQFYHPQNSIVWGAVEILMFFILIRKLQFTLLMVPLRVRFSHHEQWATIIAFRLYWPHFG